MTWGEVENTPLRVEGSETPYVDRTPGPAFKVGCGEGSMGRSQCGHPSPESLWLKTKLPLLKAGPVDGPSIDTSEPGL